MTRRAFTLIEILIAASVLGLGVLGIATLFAGAAKQQQIASDQTESNRVARNIDALLSDRFSRFAGRALDDDPALAGDPFFARGVWHPLAASPPGGVVSGILDSTLLLDLADDGLSNQSAFGLAEAGDVILYRAPWTDPLNVPASAWNTTSTIGGAAGQTFTFADLENCIDHSIPAFFNPAPYGRLQPGFRVVVSFVRETPDPAGGGGGGGGFGGGGVTPAFILPGAASDTREFAFANWNNITELQADPERWPQDPDAPVNPGSQNDRIISLVAPSEDTDGDGAPQDTDGDGMLPAPGNSGSSESWIEIRVQRPATGDAPVASIDDLLIQMPDNGSGGERWIIREIRLEDITYREDRFLSLSERISYRADDAFPGGRRPARGVAVLYRRTIDGRDQLMTLPYTLEPLGRVRLDEPDELPFIPPDTYDRLYDTSQNPANYGLLSQVRLTLGYDPNIDAYTLTPEDPADDWAIQKDQRIIVSTTSPSPADASTASRAAPPDPGADAVVRVLFNRPDPAEPGRLQAVLDDSPRARTSRFSAGSPSMLPQADAAAEIDVWAWALRPVVRDQRADKDVEWRVRPTGAQIVTLGGAS